MSRHPGPFYRCPNSGWIAPVSRADDTKITCYCGTPNPKLPPGIKEFVEGNLAIHFVMYLPQATAKEWQEQVKREIAKKFARTQTTWRLL